MYKSRISKKIFSVIIALIPLISIYRIPLLDLNMGLFITILYGIYVIRETPTMVLYKPKCLAEKMIYILLIYIFVSSILVIHLKYADSAILVKFFTMSVIICLGIRGFKFGLFNEKVIENTLIIISLTASFLIIGQSILYYVFGFTGENGRLFLIPFKALVEDYNARIVQPMILNNLFRPSAFFEEPAHFARYASVSVVFLLYNKSRKAYLVAIIISMATILSTSGLGIVLVAGIWGYYFLFEQVGSMKKKAWVISGCAFLVSVVFIFVMNRFSFFRIAILRVFGDSDVYENAFLGRMYTSFLLKTLNPVQKMIGMGFQNIPMYRNGINEMQAYFMTGIVELQYCIGYIGTILYLLICANLIVSRQKKYKMIIIIYTALVFGAGVVGTINIFFYLALVLYRDRDEIRKKDRLAGRSDC